MKLAGIVVAALLAAGGSLAQGADPLEVHELEATPERFVQQDLVVVGRFRSATSGEMSLVDSQITFRVPPRSPAIRNGADAVEVRGRLSREGERWIFTAEKVARVPSAREEFVRRRRLIPTENAAALRDLARWVRRRAEWYDDAELRALADSALSDAAQEQRARLVRSRDAQGLGQLADDLAAEGLSETQTDELRHHALHLDLAAARSPEQLAALSAKAQNLYPAARQPSAGAWPASLDEYLASPARMYDSQPPEGRAALQRLLLTEIVARELDARAAADGANLAELSTRARRELPDRPEAVARIELAAVRHDARDPARLARGRLVQLAEELRRLGQPREADSLLRAGLSAARGKLDAQDAEGRNELADAYLELLADRATAGELYLEAWDLAPGLPELPEKLSQLGYVLQGQRWRPPAGQEPTRKEANASANPLQPGTPEETVTSTLGRPGRISRVITGSGVTEQWIYEGPPRLDVYLRRAAGARTATVIGVRAP